MWQMILKRFWRVTTFRGTPADTPYSPTLLAIFSVLFYVIFTVQWSLAEVDETKISFSLAVGTAILFSYYVYTYIFLAIAGKKNRFVQTMNCLLGSYFIIHLLAFPLIIVSQLFVEEGSSFLIISILIIAFILSLFLILWQFLVTANIFRYALDLSFFSGILICLGLMGFSIITLTFLQ